MVVAYVSPGYSSAIDISNRVPEPWAVVSQLRDLLITHSSDQVLLLALLAATIDPA